MCKNTCTIFCWLLPKYEIKKIYRKPLCSLETCNLFTFGPDAGFATKTDVVNFSIFDRSVSFYDYIANVL